MATCVAVESLAAIKRHVQDRAAAVHKTLQSGVELLKHEELFSASASPLGGWQARVSVQADQNELIFSFEKTFKTMTAQEAMERMWANERKLVSYRDAVDVAADQQTLRITQQLDGDDDAYVVQRDLVDPATQLPVSSTYLRFRQSTADNNTEPATAIGLVTLAAGDGHAYASSVFVWTEFHASNSTMSSGWDVCITGATNIDDANDPKRTITSVVNGLRKWEENTAGLA